VPRSLKGANSALPEKSLYAISTIAKSVCDRPGKLVSCHGESNRTVCAGT
jgi:hypothetical protein